MKPHFIHIEKRRSTIGFRNGQSTWPAGPQGRQVSAVSVPLVLTQKDRIRSPQGTDAVVEWARYHMTNMPKQNKNVHVQSETGKDKW